MSREGQRERAVKDNQDAEINGFRRERVSERLVCEARKGRINIGRKRGGKQRKNRDRGISTLATAAIGTDRLVGAVFLPSVPPSLPSSFCRLRCSSSSLPPPPPPPPLPLRYRSLPNPSSLSSVPWKESQLSCGALPGDAPPRFVWGQCGNPCGPAR